MLISLLQTFTSTRYLFPNPYNARPKSAVYRDELLSETAEYPDDFKDALRVTPAQFMFILQLIEDHPVFATEGSKSQTDVAIQLKVALHRLGHNGSLSAYRSLSRILHTSTGSTANFTERCVAAIQDLGPRFLRWPNAEEKEVIKQGFFDKLCFRDTIGAVDGTMIDLYKAPSADRDAFSTRKHTFSMGATAISDHQGSFTYFGTGYLGRKHDSAAYKESVLYKEERAYFGLQEYLLADAAYAISETVIPRYKGNNITQRQKKFNTQHARARAKVGHAFGMLKGKFRCLSSLRLNINVPKDMDTVSDTIVVCAILHNITRLPTFFDPNDRYIDLVEENEEDRARRVVAPDERGHRKGATNRRDSILEDMLREHAHRRRLQL